MEELGVDIPGTIVNIAADGDVILVVGPGKAKLRVQSIFLEAVSKHFAAMLGPDWKEGHDKIDIIGPEELPLPDDNASALSLICAVLHHRNEIVPPSPAAIDVLAVAVTADKYGCLHVLSFASATWLRPGENKAGDLMLLAAAAYLFQNAQAFHDITRALILNYDGSYLALSCQEVESAMPWRVFCLLEGQRSRARLDLAQILIAGINDGICTHRCGWTSKYAYAYLMSLEGEKLWPADLLRVSISKAMELAETMPDPIPEEPSIACTYEYNHAAPKYRQGRRWSLDNWHESIGLCLHCVRSGNTDSRCNHG